jgi:hypothetical protein
MADGGVHNSRSAIAAMAQAAAAAAGLPDPTAADADEEPLSPMHIDESLGDGPALALAAAAAAAVDAGDEAAAGDGATRDSVSPTVPGAAAAAAATLPGAAAAGGSTQLDASLLGQVLVALQRQMQKLITLDERRSVDIVRLNAKVGMGC